MPENEKSVTLSPKYHPWPQKQKHPTRSSDWTSDLQSMKCCWQWGCWEIECLGGFYGSQNIPMNSSTEPFNSVPCSKDHNTCQNPSLFPVSSSCQLFRATLIGLSWCLCCSVQSGAGRPFPQSCKLRLRGLSGVRLFASWSDRGPHC